MLRRLYFLLKYIFYLFCIFTIGRLLFMLFHVGLLIGEDVSIGEIFQIFPHAFMLDLSTICYLLIFPVVVLFISAYFPSSKWKHVFCAYTLIITLLYALIVFSEIGIYGEWRSKLGYKAFLYIKQPMEIFRSISMWHIFIYIVLIALYVGGCAFACTKWVTEDFDRKAKTWWGPLLYILCVPGLLFLGLRGGWNQIPIYQSRSFFSNKQILNDIAVNPAWNLLRSIEVGVGKTERNPYEFYPISEAKIVVESIYQVKKDTTVKILSIDKPNIVFIVLEGWTADVLESLGGKPGITPCLHRLEKKGLLFTNVYASGKRSPQGIASIFAGFPALPDTYVFNFPEKSHKLPSLADKFKKMEYATSFYYGGVLSFDNIRAFLTTGGFDKMVEEKDYSSRLHKCKFGYPDEYVFARQFEEISTTKEPFFSVIYTLSSHTPYDQPFPKVLHWDVPELDYINSVYYTDSVIGAYFEQAKKTSWYNNTLFIIVPDHSHVSYKDHPFFSFEANHIPMLFYGNVLKPKYQGKKQKVLTMQHDIPAILLKQVGSGAEDFHWSRNVFNPFTKPFVYMEANQGFGYKTTEGEFIWDGLNKKYIDKKLPTNSLKAEKIIKEGNSFLEVLYDEFLQM